MRGDALVVCCFVACLVSGGARPAPAQQEVYHPGETYDSLQAGRDAYLDAEAQRRALIGRQIMIENQIVEQNTWPTRRTSIGRCVPSPMDRSCPRSMLAPR